MAKHLSAVCPLTGKALENENERKLRLILSKAQQHQRQLQEEISENISNNSQNSSPSSVRKKPASRIQSPRCKFIFPFKRKLILLVDVFIVLQNYYDTISNNYFCYLKLTFHCHCG